MLAKSNLNSIETLVSQALIDMEISHKGFFTILKEKDKHEKIKENLKNVVVNMRLNTRFVCTKRVVKQIDLLKKKNCC